MNAELHKIEMIEIDGMIVRALVVNNKTPHEICEICGKPNYHHPLLAKTSPEWCMNCDDKFNRAEMDDFNLGLWSMEQMLQGRVICIVNEDKV